MKKIVFVSDVFYTDHLIERGVGGAEKSDAALIERLSKDYEVTKIVSAEYHAENFAGYDQTIFSNCTRLNQHRSDYTGLKIGGHIIIHHDYQFLHTRNPYQQESQAMLPMLLHMKNARANLYQTDFHCNLTCNIFDSIGREYLTNPISLGCTFMGEDELDNFKSLLNLGYDELRPYVILNNPNPLKGVKRAIDYADKSGLEYQLIDPKDHEQLMHDFRASKGLIFFPLSPETCCRTAIEIKCLGRELHSSMNYGITASDIFKLSGINLINKIKELNDSAYANIRKIIDNE